MRRFTLATVRDLVLALALVPFVLPLWLLPWRLALGLGRTYGSMGFLAWGTARRAGMVNLRRALGGGVTRASARSSVHAVFRGLGQSLAEGIQFSRRHRDGDSWRSLVEVEDPALAARLLEDPRPKVFVTGHLGSWEMALQLLDLVHPGRGAAIVRRVDNPFLQRIVLALRVRDRSQWIEKTGAIPEALSRLRAGWSVALLLDENGGLRGPFVPFFGRPASTRKTAALLAAASGAPLVLGAVVRRPGAALPYAFRLALFDPPSTDPADVARATRDLVSAWEAWVREDPLQWRWIHWRWRTRPDGTEETYDRRDVAEAFAAGNGDAADEDVKEKLRT